jgi:hemoglobin-like flavoprotein
MACAGAQVADNMMPHDGSFHCILNMFNMAAIAAGTQAKPLPTTVVAAAVCLERQRCCSMLHDISVAVIKVELQQLVRYRLITRRLHTHGSSQESRTAWPVSRINFIGFIG